MKTILYPTFDKVFTDKSLQGIFYPLCTISELDTVETELFVISTNGLWFDLDYRTEFNQESYVCFDIVHGKYVFRGDLNFYKGFEIAQQIYPILDKDFKINGQMYLSNKTKAVEYINILKNNLPSDVGNLDLEHYLETFYSFFLNKLHYQNTSEFRRVLYENFFNSPTCLNTILYDKLTQEFINSYQELYVDGLDLDSFIKIGKTVGFEYFFDGNDSVLLYDSVNTRAYCMNHYS